MALTAQCKTLSRWPLALEFASGQCSLHRRSVIYITISASGHLTSSTYQIFKSTFRYLRQIHAKFAPFTEAAKLITKINKKTVKEQMKNERKEGTSRMKMKKKERSVLIFCMFSFAGVHYFLIRPYCSYKVGMC